MAGAPSKAMKRIMKAGVGVHIALYRASGGRFANRVANLPVLLLTTYGRKTGKPFTTPVVYVREGDDYLVSGSGGGSDAHPGWSLNLKARPDAKIEVGSTALNVTATPTQGDERTRLYAKFKAASQNFVGYEQKTSREIPVFRLTPALGRSNGS